MGTLCCGRRQEATTAAAAVPATRIDWPPAAAGWPAPRLRDALKNQRNIKPIPRKRTTTPTEISRPALGDLLPYAIHIIYAGARARTEHCTRIRTSARDGQHERLHTLHHSHSISCHTRLKWYNTYIYRNNIMNFSIELGIVFIIMT